MPGPIIADPTPRWLQPEHASVLDSPVTKAIRLLASLIGANDPQSQVLSLMAPMVPKGQDTAGPAVTAIQKAIRAFHGSPHDFDKFSMSKIGTGEGAQAYGHGLYFAENEGVAQGYKRVLGGREFTIGERRIVASGGNSTRALDGQTFGESLAATALDDAFNAQSSAPAQFAANWLRKQKGYYPEESAHIDEALQHIAEWQKHGQSQKLTGKMYEVGIHADPEQFLDWDQPLSQQPHIVEKLDRAGFYPFMGDEAGAVYRPKDAAGAAALKAAGIPGIKYLDEGSRASAAAWGNTANQTRNYVVFDDKLIDILKKYGVALPVIEGLRRKAAAHDGTVSQADIDAAKES